MSLYNMMCGRNDSLLVFASVIMGFNIKDTFPRFRDIFLKADDSPIKGDLFVYTRMGGGNANCWEDGENENCTCPACTADKLKAEPWYAGDYDDDFDCTYRTYVITLTGKMKEELEHIKSGKPAIELDNFIERLSALFPDLGIEVIQLQQEQPNED